MPIVSNAFARLIGADPLGEILLTVSHLYKASRHMSNIHSMVTKHRGKGERRRHEVSSQLTIDRNGNGLRTTICGKSLRWQNGYAQTFVTESVQNSETPHPGP